MIVRFKRSTTNEWPGHGRRRGAGAAAVPGPPAAGPPRWAQPGTPATAPAPAAPAPDGSVGPSPRRPATMPCDGSTPRGTADPNPDRAGHSPAGMPPGPVGKPASEKGLPTRPRAVTGQRSERRRPRQRSSRRARPASGCRFRVPVHEVDELDHQQNDDQNQEQGDEQDERGHDGGPLQLQPPLQERAVCLLFRPGGAPPGRRLSHRAGCSAHGFRPMA